MKFFKSTFITLLLLIVCSVTAMAKEVPGQTVQYVDQDGSIKTAQNVIQITPESTKDANEPNSLTVGNWYWLGKEAEGSTSTVEITNGLSITPPDAPGEINIITGPNGGYKVNAMNITGNLTIPKNVTVNVYGAPNDSGDNQVLYDQNCFVQFSGTASKPGITVSQGGTLNVLSGTICGRGCDKAETEGNYPTGIQVEGTVTIEDLGELQGTTCGTDSTSYGITVSTTNPAGSFQANGGSVYSYNNNKSYSPISGVSNLIVDGSTVYSLTPYTDVPATSLKNGVWWGNNANNVTTLVAFGKSTFTMNGYKLSGSFTSGDTFTVQNGAELTLGDFDLSFGDQSTLDIDQGGALIIPSTTDVTMQSGSVLTNDGIIDVQGPSTETPANS